MVSVIHAITVLTCWMQGTLVSWRTEKDVRNHEMGVYHLEFASRSSGIGCEERFLFLHVDVNHLQRDLRHCHADWTHWINSIWITTAI